jgi:hypothetical protein
MQLKRKRSTDLSASTSPFSATSNTTSSILSRQSHSPSPFQSHSGPHQTAGINSRTLKRFRDNRPSEDMIHQKTMQRLYAAQRQGQAVQPIMSAALEEDGPQRQVGMAIGQKSLESFWRVANARPSTQTRSGTSIVVGSQGVRCQDCDAPMKETQIDGEGDYNMISSTPLKVTAHSGGGQCEGCEKVVCGLCSLVRVHRVCLECAGRVWT